MAKAGYLESVVLDFKLGFPSGTRTRDLRVSSPAFFQPAVTTPTDWAMSLRLGSFSSGWTAALFRDPDKHERYKQQSKTRKPQLNLRWRPWRYAILCLCSCSWLHWAHVTETHLELEVASKDKEKKTGYLQIVALDFNLLGVGLELGTFGHRAQSSNHSTTPPWC